MYTKKIILLLTLSILFSIDNASLYEKEAIAQNYHNSMLYDDAIIIYEEILEIKKNIFGSYNINLLETVKKIYELYLLNNESDQALYYLQEYINIQSSNIIQQQKSYVDPLNNLKEIYTNQKDPDLVFQIDSLLNIINNNLDIFNNDSLSITLPKLLINKPSSSETEYTIDDIAIEKIELAVTYLNNGLYTEAKMNFIDALSLRAEILDINYFENLDFGIEKNSFMNILEEEINQDSLNTSNYFYLGLINYKNNELEKSINYFTKYNQHYSYDINTLLFLGKINEQLDNWLDAIFYYHRCLKIDSNNFNANLSLAISLMKIDNHKEAINILKYIIKENNDNFKLVYSLGKSYFFERDYNNAIKYLTQSLLLNSDNYEVYYYLGLAYNAIEAHKKALDALKKTISINPNFSLAHYELAKIYQIILNDELAIKHYVLARKDLNNDDLNYQLGMLYYKNEEYFKAMDPLKEYILKHLNDIETLKILASIFMNIDRYPEAIDIYLRLINLNDSLILTDNNKELESNILYLTNIANAYFKLNDFDNAIEYYLKLLEINENDYETLVSIGTIYNKQNIFSESEKYLTQALELNYPNKLLLIQLGISYGGQKKFLQSLITFKDALKLSLEDPVIHYQLGIIYKELEIYNLAIEEFLFYLNTNKKDDITLLLIGECYMKLDDYNNAITYLNKSYKINSNTKSLFNIGKCYEKIDDAKNAAKYFKLVIKQDPNHVKSREKLIYIYLNSYRYREAKKECEIIYMLDRSVYNSINYCIE